MIVTRTPLRVSFLGGGTDFPEFYNEHGGAVLSTAIDKYIYVVVKKRFDEKIILHYTKTETLDSVDEIEHDIIRECMRLVGVEKGIEITTLADIPSEGTGLGSSSSLTVGLLLALYTYLGIENIPPELLAEDACKVEIDMMGKAMGIQDPYIASYGGLRMFTYDKDGVDASHFRRRIRKQVGNRILLFYSGVTRQATGILDEQKERISANAETLEKMLEMAIMGKVFLDGEQYDDFGGLIKKSWEMKKTLASNITNDYLTDIVADASSAGAIGYKICGAGGGGFLLIYCQDGGQDNIRKVMSKYQELPVKVEEQGSKIIYQE
ncbi:MAG: GHMP kinase [Proteobacteria bacterium]|nr:GHMP kinase [Pseudomonadota bacterium]